MSASDLSFLGDWASGSFDGSSSGDDYTSLSTVNPNPSVDQTSGNDGGASDIATIVNSIGQWGATIGSLALNRPLAVTPTRAGGVQAIGVAGSRVQGQSLTGNNVTLILVAAAVVVVIILVAK